MNDNGLPKIQETAVAGVGYRCPASNAGGVSKEFRSCASPALHAQDANGKEGKAARGRDLGDERTCQ